VRRALDRLRARFPAAYWRARNALALAELYARRLPAGADAYDDTFWDFHSPGDWDGFARVILKHTGARSVVDIGCGQGVLLAGLAASDPRLQLRGYDYSPSAVRRARERGLRVEPLDFMKVTAGEARTLARELASIELALCLEVAEHLPPWRSAPLLTVVSAPRTLVFSAAHPNQGGHLHVNEQPASYWIERLGARGMTLAPSDDAFRQDVAALDLPWWYARNIHLFVKD
jgi:SAM-dependent methyltransferase